MGWPGSEESGADDDGQGVWAVGVVAQADAAKSKIL